MTLRRLRYYDNYLNNANSLLARIPQPPRKENNADAEQEFILVRLPYAGIHGEHLVLSLLLKLNRYFKKKVTVRILYQTNKIYSYCSTKDRLNKDQTSYTKLNVRVVEKNILGKQTVILLLG